MTDSMEAGKLHSTVQGVCGANEGEGPLQEDQVLGDLKGDFDQSSSMMTAAMTKVNALDVDSMNGTVSLDIDGNVGAGMVLARVVHLTGCDVRFDGYWRVEAPETHMNDHKIMTEIARVYAETSIDHVESRTAIQLGQVQVRDLGTQSLVQSVLAARDGACAGYEVCAVCGAYGASSGCLQD